MSERNTERRDESRPPLPGPRLVERDGFLVAERAGPGPVLDWRAVRRLLDRLRR